MSASAVNACFEVLEKLGYGHKVVIASHGKAGNEIESFKWLNVLTEVQYRFNRRADMAAMLPRMAVAVMHTLPCPKRRILSSRR